MLQIGRPLLRFQMVSLKFHRHNLSDRTMALGSTQPLTEMGARRISWGQMRPVRKVDNLTNSLCRCHEIGNLNFLEPSGSRSVTGLICFYLQCLKRRIQGVFYIGLRLMNEFICWIKKRKKNWMTLTSLWHFETFNEVFQTH